jgi:hypothetical protein
MLSDSFRKPSDRGAEWVVVASLLTAAVAEVSNAGGRPVRPSVHQSSAPSSFLGGAKDRERRKCQCAQWLTDIICAYSLLLT